MNTSYRDHYCDMTIGSTHGRVVVLLKPRLDIPFKGSGDAPEHRGPIQPIRLHWVKFMEQVVDEHTRRGDWVVEIERPMWQINQTYLETMLFPLFSRETIVYIPHHTQKTLPVSHPLICPYYYMQTVFPDHFTVDPTGWGPSMTTYPIQPVDFTEPAVRTVFVHRVYERAARNQSKFPQRAFEPNARIDHPYYLFCCQIPHDQSIQLHSDVSVAQALRWTLEWAKQHDRRIHVRGHPVNPGSMLPLKAITEEFPGIGVWQDGADESIHQAISRSRGVFTVNSGSGIEAIIHEKPLVTFGRAEYDTVSFRYSEHQYEDDLTGYLDQSRDPKVFGMMATTYSAWMVAYLRLLYDTTEPSTFRKLP